MKWILAAIAVLTLFLLASPEKRQRTIRIKPWGKFRPGDRIIILGLPFTGKTVLAAKLTIEADRVAYFDPMHDYSGLTSARECTVSELLENPDILQEPKWRIAIIPDEENMDEELEDTIRLIRAAGNAVLVFDEVGDYRQSNEQLLNKVARNGRHDGIVPIYVSQVATDIPLTVRRLGTRVYSFQQFYPKDIRALTETFGEPFALQVQELKGHELAIWILPTLPSTLRHTKTESENSSEVEKISQSP